MITNVIASNDVNSHNGIHNAYYIPYINIQMDLYGCSGSKKEIAMFIIYKWAYTDVVDLKRNIYIFMILIL